MQDVATFLRSSSRFSLRFSSKAREDILAALSNFSFAPQRFSSKERPLTRIVLVCRSTMLVLGLEVISPPVRHGEIGLTRFFVSSKAVLGFWLAC